VKQLDEEPKAFAERFYKAVKEVNAEANSIWNDTHGCETCAKHWHGVKDGLGVRLVFN
jgi:hypothetical protein